VWLAKIKKKKLQYIFLSIIIILTVALISTCTIFTVISNTFTDEYYKGDDTPEIMAVTDSYSVKEKVRAWYKDQGDTVRNLKEYETYSSSNNLRLKDRILKATMGYIVTTNSMGDLSWKLKVVEGNTKEKAPQKGEIWISNILAEAEKINIGDQITIKSESKDNEFQISGIINDSNQPSSTLGVQYVYINEEDKDAVKDLPKANFITLNTDKDSAKTTKELITYINEPLSGFIINKSTLKMCASLTPTLIGGVGMVACILVLGVVLIVLRHTLWNNILKEYRFIGIYKSMGFSSREIQEIYLKCYGFVVIISSFLGCLISIPISSYICRIIFKYLGKYSFDFSSFLFLASIFLLFNFIILGGLKLTLIRINKIKPVEAINIGIKSSKEKFNKSIIKDNSSSMAMAINDIFKYKKQNLVMLTIFILVFYTSITFTNIYNSVDQINNNFKNWFGTPRSDMVVTASIDEKDTAKKIKEYLRTSNLIESQNSWDCYSNRFISIDNTKYDVDTSSFVPSVFNYYNEEDFNIEIGRNPRQRNEVALNKGILEKSNLKVGDYMELLIKGNKENFLITGSYESMVGNHQNIRLLTDVIEKNANGNALFIKLKDKDDYESLRTDILNKFDDLSVDKVSPMLEGTVSQVKDIMLPVVILLLIGVGAFSILTIISMVVSNNLDNRKNFGIIKSLGFSNSYIRRRISSRIILLALLGNIVGLIINLFVNRDLFKVSVMGTDGYIFTTSGTCLVSLTLLILTILSVIISCRSIKNISTVELIVE